MQSGTPRLLRIIKLLSTCLSFTFLLNVQNGAVAEDRPDTIYEHQKPLLSVAWLIGLHLPGPGFPVVPQARQIQALPC
jgi:hypothetical protein